MLVDFNIARKGHKWSKDIGGYGNASILRLSERGNYYFCSKHLVPMKIVQSKISKHQDDLREQQIGEAGN